MTAVSYDAAARYLAEKYNVPASGPHREGDLYIVPSQTTRGLYYKVLVGPSGITCTCPWYEAKLGKPPCNHIKRISEEFSMTTQALMKVSPPTAVMPTEREMESMDMIAARLIDSKEVALPTNLKTQGDVRAVILAGWELGVKPMSALRHMSVINGKTEPDGQLMASIAAARDPSIMFEIIEDTDDATTVRLTRKSTGLRVEYRYTQEDAKKAGLANKTGPWSQHPRTMRRWACYKNLCRAYLGNLINGVEVAGTYVPPPADGMVEDPQTIEGESRVIVDGEIVNSTLYNDGDEPDPHGDPQEAPASASSGPAVSNRGDTGSLTPPASPPGDGPASEEQKAEVTRLVMACKADWSPRDYGDLFRGLGERFMPGEPKFDPAKLTAAAAADCIADLKQRRGEP